MEVYRVNIDFEQQLQNSTINPVNLPWQYEWEYLFWWIESPEKKLFQSQKYSPRKYSSDYLDYISSFTDRSSFFNKSDCNYSQVINWWGDLNQKKIILKSDLPLIRREVLKDSSSYLLTYELSPKFYPCIIKKPYSFSGKGVYQVNNEEDFQKVFKSRETNNQLLIEPLHEVGKHFGAYYYSKNNYIFYENFSSHKNYTGSLFNRDLSIENPFYKDHQLIHQFIDEKYNIDHGYGIDSYNHLKGIQSLCEINHRKTIASTSYKIFNKYFSEFQLGRNYIFKAPRYSLKKIEEIDMKLRECSEKIKILRLSPLRGQFFFHYFIGANSFNDLLLGRKQLENLFNLS